MRKANEIKHFSSLEHIWWGAKTPAGQKRYDNKFTKLVEVCKPKNGIKILEIGAGDGEFTNRLKKLNANIVATDITPVVIKRAKRNIKKKNIKFKIENAEKLSFKNESFDLVCGVSILHHLSIQKALKEVHRVLKIGGKAFFTEPNLINPIIFLGLNIPELRKKMEFSPDETALMRYKTKKILKKTGFRKSCVSNYDFLFPKTPISLMSCVEKLGNILEKTPLIKEISGSLLIYAEK